MWNVQATVIPAVTGTTATISKPLRQYLNNRPGEHEIKELQTKTAILGTAHTLRYGRWCKNTKRISWAK